MPKRTALIIVSFILSALLPCLVALLFFELIPAVPKLFGKFQNSGAKRFVYDIVLPLLIYSAFPPSFMLFLLTGRRARIFPFHGGFFRFLIQFAKFLAICAVIAVPFGFFADAIETILGRDGATAAAFVALIAGAWLYVRVSPAFAAAADRTAETYGFRKAWTVTEGQTIKLLGLHLIVFAGVWALIVLLQILSNAAGPQGGGVWIPVVQQVLIFVQLALFSAIAVKTYRSGRPTDQ